MARPTPLRMRLQATVAMLGTTLLFWWRGGPWAGGAAIAAICLAALAWLRPRWYEPVQRALDRGVHGVLVGLTWLLLTLVFALVFVPGRLVLGRPRRPIGRRGGKSGEGTYWREARSPAGADAFGRQF